MASPREPTAAISNTSCSTMTALCTGNAMSFSFTNALHRQQQQTSQGLRQAYAQALVHQEHTCSAHRWTHENVQTRKPPTRPLPNSPEQ